MMDHEKHSKGTRTGLEKEESTHVFTKGKMGTIGEKGIKVAF